MALGIVVAVDAEHEARVVAALSSHPSRVTIVRRPADDAELLAGAHSGHGSIVLLSRYFPGFDADLVRQLARWGIRVLGLSDDAAFMARMGIGVTLPVESSADDMLAAIESLPADPAVPPLPAGSPQVGGPPTATQGRIVTVWGTAGAPGRSTVALGIADELAASGASTMIVDADTVASSTASMLGLLDDTPGITALCRAASRGELTPRVFEAQVAMLESGLGVVTGLNRMDRWPEIRPAALEAVLTMARDLVDVVVVDCSHLRDDDDGMDFSLGRHSATGISVEMADEVVLVAAADPVGLQRLVLMLGEEYVRALDVEVVMNRVRPSAVGKDPEGQIRGVLSRFSGREPLEFIPEDRAGMDHAVLAGKTLRESGARSPARVALERLAATLALRVREGDTLTV